MSFVTFAELGTYLASLPDNPPPAELHTIKLAPVNISNVWGDINDIVAASGKYVTLDLFGCYATDDTISGRLTSSDNDMNIIQGTPNIKGIVLPSGLISIGDSAFLNCTGLTSITIPDSVQSIERNAFVRCTSLTSITIPDSVQSIEWNTFGGCTSLTSITIPNNVTSIGDYAFAGCTGLTSITISDGVTRINQDAFSRCSGFTSIIIPSSVTTIEARAFQLCASLTSVRLPNSVTTFGQNAFPQETAGYGSNVLRSVYQATGGIAGTYTRSPGGIDWALQ